MSNIKIQKTGALTLALVYRLGPLLILGFML